MLFRLVVPLEFHRRVISKNVDELRSNDRAPARHAVIIPVKI